MTKKKVIKVISTEKIDQIWHVYILKTLSGQLYTGITSDLVRRMKQHKNGNGGRFTRTFGFKKLLYSEESTTRSEALKREAEVKRWPKKKKVQLIKGLIIQRKKHAK